MSEALSGGYPSLFAFVGLWQPHCLRSGGRRYSTIPTTAARGSFFLPSLSNYERPIQWERLCRKIVPCGGAVKEFAIGTLVGSRWLARFNSITSLLIRGCKRLWTIRNMIFVPSVYLQWSSLSDFFPTSNQCPALSLICSHSFVNCRFVQSNYHSTEIMETIVKLS